VEVHDVRWLPVHDSTIVDAAAYDAAAERIYVRLRSGLTQYFDDCPEAEWHGFMADDSKGRYLTQVLQAKRSQGHLGTPANPRPPRTEQVRRAVYLNAFRPALEMTDPARFAGRVQQVRQLADSLQQAGSFPLIYGDSGLGKTSLAVQAQQIAMGDTRLLGNIGSLDLALPDDRTFLTLFVTCSDSVHDVEALLQLMINAAEDVVPATDDPSAASQLVDRTTSRKVTLKLFEAEIVRKYSPIALRSSFQSLSLRERLQRLVRLLNQTYASPVLIVVDELDRMPSKVGLGSLVRLLSNEDLKFLVVGIAEDTIDLISDHSSVERIVTPIAVPRMSRPELAEAVDLAVKALHEAGSSLRFDEPARKRLVEISGGFPWFIHVIGQASVMLAVERGLQQVGVDQVNRAVRELVSNEYARLFRDRYGRAVRESSKREITLKVLAHWRSPDIPASAAYAALRRVGLNDPGRYRSQLATETFGGVLLPRSDTDRDVIRFRNEMFRQYAFLTPSIHSGVAQLADAAVTAVRQ
jgi:hypothetical protein